MNRYIAIGLTAALLIAAALGYSRCSRDDQSAGGDAAAPAGQEQPAVSSDTAATGEATTPTDAGGEQPSLADGDSQQATAMTGVATGSNVPSFDVVRIDAAGGMVIAGRAAPGATVSVTSDGQVIGTVTADGNGEWVLLPSTALPPGNHQLGLTATLPSGETVAATQQVMIAMPGTVTDLAGQAADQSGQALAVLVPTEENGATVVLQAPAATGEAAAGGIASGELALDSVDYGDGGDFTIGGRAPPGARVNVYLDNQPIGSATADPAGHWQLAPATAVEPGLHTLRVDQIGGDGAVIARVETPFERAGPVALAAGQQFVVQPGNSLWRIARRAYGEGLRYSVIYQANKSQIRDPDLIYPGQIFTIPQDGSAPAQ